MTERGSASPLIAAAIGWLAMLAVAVAAVALLYAARAGAVNAADAAALAAAVATYPPAGSGSVPSEAAGRGASANGAKVIRCVCPVDLALSPRTVMVVVETVAEVPILGRVPVRAVATAEFDPQRWLGG